MREMYCITCPIGCKLLVERFGESLKVEGNGCNKGAEFAETEVFNPTRSLTTTVRTTFPGVPVLPVRTDGEIPKGKIMEAMAALSKVVVGHELDCGDTVIEDIVGSGVRVIATSDALIRKNQQYTKKNRPPGAGGYGDGPGGRPEFGGWSSGLSGFAGGVSPGGVSQDGVSPGGALQGGVSPYGEPPDEDEDGAAAEEEAPQPDETGTGSKQKGRPHIRSKKQL